jgi:hypothetical protein
MSMYVLRLIDSAKPLINRKSFIAVIAVIPAILAIGRPKQKDCTLNYQRAVQTIIIRRLKAAFRPSAISQINGSYGRL